MLIKFVDPENIWLDAIFIMLGQDLVEATSQMCYIFCVWPTRIAIKNDSCLTVVLVYVADLTFKDSLICFLSRPWNTL